MDKTDTFGVDQVKPIHDAIDYIGQRFESKMRPHIHVDAAVGWPIAFFTDYDFHTNPLDINAATLDGLRKNSERFLELQYADSITIDFHKWEFVPYSSSLVLVKDRSSMAALEHDPEYFSYFEKDVQGYTHLQSTIGCSRSATGVFGAFAALQSLGVDGYRVLIAHGLQNASYFCSQVTTLPHTKLTSTENHGPSVGFRMYPHGTDAEDEYAFELAYSDTNVYRNHLEQNTAFHRGHFLGRKVRHLYTNWASFTAHIHYDSQGCWRMIPGEKAVFMNPLTDRKHIDAIVEQLRCPRDAIK